MEIDAIFELPDTVVNDSVLEGDRLRIGQSLDPELFLKIYSPEIKAVGLSPEKALYLAMSVDKKRSPTPHSQMRIILS